MKSKIVLSVLASLIASQASAVSMTCKVMAPKAMDFVNNGGQIKDVSVDLSKPDARGDYTQVAVVNGTRVELILSPLGKSDAYEQIVGHRGVGSSAPFETWTVDALFFMRSENGIPGTNPGDWPFPGPAKGDIFVTYKVRGGSLALTMDTVNALKAENLWGTKITSRIIPINSTEIFNLTEAIKTLVNKGAISPTALIGVGSVGDCYRK